MFAKNIILQDSIRQFFDYATQLSFAKGFFFYFDLRLDIFKSERNDLAYWPK